jgi:uncharacterized protein YkwD
VKKNMSRAALLACCLLALHALGARAQDSAANALDKPAVRTPGAAPGAAGGVTRSSPRALPADTGAVRSPGAPKAGADSGLDDLQQAALERVNYHRTLAGLAPVAADARLLKVAQSHSAYLDSRNEMGHYESDRSNPYYTGNSPFDRIDASGYRYEEAGEVVARESSSYPPAAIDALMTAIYHRFIILLSNVTQAGPGAVLKAHQGTEELSVTVDFGAETLPPAPAPTAPTLYPIDGHRGVPVDFNPSEEEPNPMPGQTLTGYPVSVQVDPRYTFEVTTFELYALTGSAPKRQDAKLLSNSTDSRTPKHAAALIPNSPLAPGTRYQAAFSGTVNGAPVSRSWQFTTAPAAPVTITFASPSVPLGATQRIQLAALDEEKGPYYVCYSPSRMVKSLTHETETELVLATGGECEPDRPCQITVLATYHSACKDPFATGTFAVTR